MRHDNEWKERHTFRLQQILRVLVLLAGGLTVESAHATPVACSPGYQDNTCLTAIRHGSVPAPGCPAGWTQTSAPVWQGSHWSSPGCAAPPPPPVQPPPVSVPTPDQKQFCVNYSLANGFYKGGLGQRLWRLIGPVSGVGTSAYTSKAYQRVPGAGWFDPNGSDPIWGGKGSFDPPNVPTDMVYFNNGVVNVCYFTPGTVNLIGYLNAAGVNNGGGGG